VYEDGVLKPLGRVEMEGGEKMEINIEERHFEKLFGSWKLWKNIA